MTRRKKPASAIINVITIAVAHAIIVATVAVIETARMIVKFAIILSVHLTPKTLANNRSVNHKSNAIATRAIKIAMASANNSVHSAKNASHGRSVNRAKNARHERSVNHVRNANHAKSVNARIDPHVKSAEICVKLNNRLTKPLLIMK
jgi:hypothetical protein